ncbi:DUF5658 family protein [uncultured Methanolobus sp.]|uniref:DUF5658 family protein n=1 Tax=uncultured Methanolobus sp. TaxID=218300 RepID=UPI0029C7B96E|nr:DUF5658 family protein [uncultured Methanolobus sp.]
MSFLKDIKPLFLLFILGDTITTIYALQTGLFYEGNPVLSYLFNSYGILSLIPLKLGFLFLLYKVYNNADRFYWNITRYAVSFIGLLATVSNTAVVLHG